MIRAGIVGWAMLLAAFTLPDSADAHCDSLDGPVVRAARVALTDGDVTPVLRWVRPEDEAVITEAFRKTVSVRSLNADARELADKYFYETVVRIHREAEGAPYTGLKPAGEAGTGIAMADTALETGTTDELLTHLTELIRHGVHERYAQAADARQRADNSVALGREYVASYVTFIHYVEAIHEAASISPAHGAEH